VNRNTKKSGKRLCTASPVCPSAAPRRRRRAEAERDQDQNTYRTSTPGAPAAKRTPMIRPTAGHTVACAIEHDDAELAHEQRDALHRRRRAVEAGLDVACESVPVFMVAKGALMNGTGSRNATIEPSGSPEGSTRAQAAGATASRSSGRF
jgi:hypothetical protein